MKIISFSGFRPFANEPKSYYDYYDEQNDSFPQLIIQMGDGCRLVDGTVTYKNTKMPPSSGITLERDIYKINKDGEKIVEKTSYFHIHLNVVPSLLLASKTLYEKSQPTTPINNFKDFCKVHKFDLKEWESFYDLSKVNCKKVPECKFRIDRDMHLIGQVVNLHKMTIDSITLERTYPSKENPSEKSTFAVSFPYNLFEAFYFGLCLIAARRQIECAAQKN